MVLVMRYMNPDQFEIRDLPLDPDKNKLCVIDTSINMLVLSYILSIIIDSINKFTYTDIKSSGISSSRRYSSNFPYPDTKQCVLS